MASFACVDDGKGAATYYFKQEPGTAAFEEELRAWQAGDSERRKIGVSRVRPGSVSDLIARWYVSPQFSGFEPSTRATFRGIAERFREEHGSMPVAGMQREHIKALIAKRAAVIGPSGAPTRDAANNLLKVLRMIMRFAVDEKMTSDDPTLGVRALKVKTDGFHSWEESENEAYEKAHAIGTRPRLALALLLYTAQRRSDVIRMGRQHIRDGKIVVRQKKTGTALTIPIHPELARAIASCPSEQMTLLVTGYGKPFTAAGFTNWFRDQCRKAELPERCSPHAFSSPHVGAWRTGRVWNRPMLPAT